MKDLPNNSEGSQWSKWDLHVHPPLTKLNDQYKFPKGDVLDKFCVEIEKSDVDVFGISDYFSVDTYFSFLKKFQAKYPDSTKRFLPNIEFRLEDKNKDNDHINIHVILSPILKSEEIERFLSSVPLKNVTKEKLVLKCSESDLKQIGYDKAVVVLPDILKSLQDSFGERDCWLIIGVANGYGGIRPLKAEGRQSEKAKIIDEDCNLFFGRAADAPFFVSDRYDNCLPKAVVSGSDSHSFEDLENSLGKQKVEQINGKEVVTRDVTWIKANTTFEGLKQILYEPYSGERVYIGLQQPDLKDSFKVIKSITFSNSTDFPETVTFNSNLSSIVGSRSSGKSALLAYVAHGVDQELTEEELPGGPGAGYPWHKVDFDYNVHWANGKPNEESPGKVVFIRQNYLYDLSGQPQKIKEKIEPVLFKAFPEFQKSYNEATAKIDEINQEINEIIDVWFKITESLASIQKRLKTIGDKKAIEQEKKETEQKIEELKKKYKLSAEDLKKYQDITKEISGINSRIATINDELDLTSFASGKDTYFKNAKVSLTPAIGTIPERLQEEINKIIEAAQTDVLTKANKEVASYKAKLIDEKTRLLKGLDEINLKNGLLIEKHAKNAELETLVKKLNELNDTLSKIDVSEKRREVLLEERKNLEGDLKKHLDSRDLIFTELKNELGSIESVLDNIKFGIDCGLGDYSFISRKINAKEKSKFIEDGDLNITVVRQYPAEFLNSIEDGSQKINANNDKKLVTQEVLTLTERILFTAEMEGDTIGGFSEPTMTPGKRALFALRLILAESEDTWPLLIDQPEDDLDSRSIYDEIVPFLKKKKKERQIIMVSHNANLVIGADSEQIVVTNRHGDDRKNASGKQFNYLTGGIENTKEKDQACSDTLDSQGICEHTCEILDGGKLAFEYRRNKYYLRSKK